MTIRESIRSQWETIKNRSAKEKLSYLWDYYGIKAICALVALILLIAFVTNMATKKDYAYTGVFFGATQQSESFLSDFAKAALIDTEAYDLTVQTYLDIRMDDKITDETYQAMQAFAAMVAAGMVDNIAADVDLFLYYSYLGYTTDLRTVLTPQQLSELSPHLYYIDGELLRQQENSDNCLTFDYGNCPDPKAPEAMSDPIPVGISIRAATEAFQRTYTFSSKEPVVGICAGSEKPGTSLAFLEYALGLPLTVTASEG